MNNSEDEKRSQKVFAEISETEPIRQPQDSLFRILNEKPIYLINQILRKRIFNSLYWKEQLFGANIQKIIKETMDLKYVGGTYGRNQKPTKFLCLLAKTLQIKLDEEILIALITNEDHKYISLLGLFYLRLTGIPVKIYQLTEEFYSDYRKIVWINKNGQIEKNYFDEIAEKLLKSQNLFSLSLPKIPCRIKLENQGKLEKRVSLQDQELETN